MDTPEAPRPRRFTVAILHGLDDSRRTFRQNEAMWDRKTHLFDGSVQT